MENNKIVVGAVVVGALVIGGLGLYFYNQPENTPLQNTQTPSDTTAQNGDANKKTLSVVASESLATYELNEHLRGTPTHVKGTTSTITGTIAVLDSGIEIGNISIDANTFKTDIAMRDENVRKLVLKTDQPGNQFIVFTPTSITGMPTTKEVGKSFPITITGNIVVTGITKQVTFTGTAQWSTENSITIDANTTLTYGDFGVTIPNFSFLANVDKTVLLSVHLVAK